MNSLVTQVLDRLVAEIEAGKNPWKKSWTGGGGMPSNAVTRKTYRGINTLLLWMAGLDKGYATNEWATLKQWGGAGRRIRKGEKGTPILFYKILEKGEGDEKSRFPMMRVSWAFNRAQLDQAEAEPCVAQPQPDEHHARAQAWFEGSGIKLGGAGGPGYSPLLDMIAMPPASSFDSLDEYWTTMFHEGVHWTGHKSRLDRFGPVFGVKGSETYAAEELVAEIGAAFMGAEFGIDTEKNNAAYLRGWLSEFKDKRQAILTAARDAGKAYEFLINLQQQQQEQAA